VILSVKGLGFSYPARHVFNDWQHEFGVGLTWLRGPNGSGKSTLLQLLAGALPLRSGTLTVNGIDAVQQPIAYRREVFWCGSGSIAFDHLRPPEYFGFMRSLYPQFDAGSLPAQIAGFGLAAQLDMPLAALSAGTQRKVWLAAALVANTAAVLIDEPVNALDTASLSHLHRELQRCAVDASRAWIVTSHEPLGPAGALARCVEL
jgi:ABC-type multidrug transport system ATPase subunit